MLVTDGGRMIDDAGNQSDLLTAHKFARVVELRHTSPPEKVFELSIDDAGGVDWSVYRSVKLPDLYPETIATVTR